LPWELPRDYTRSTVQEIPTGTPLYKLSANGIWKLQKRQHNLVQASQIFRLGNDWGGFDEAPRYLGIADRATGAPGSPFTLLIN
jgi:hypothetical protein